MVLEVAILDVIPDRTRDFEEAFAEAQSIISSMPGYCRHELQRCLETAGRYLLLVWWIDLESHSVGFRGSSQYRRWKQLLHHFYEPFPTVEHYTRVNEGTADAESDRRHID
jgi:heme-degrading monooxygenase HmoA